MGQFSQEFFYENSKSMMMITPIISHLFLGISLQAYTEGEEDSPYYITAVGDGDIPCSSKSVHQTRGVHQYIWGAHVWRTGPFAQNPNKGWHFNDGSLARIHSSPRSTFRDIVSSTAYINTDNMCSAIKTQYGDMTSTHPDPPVEQHKPKKRGRYRKSDTSKDVQITESTVFHTQPAFLVRILTIVERALKVMDSMGILSNLHPIDVHIFTGLAKLSSLQAGK